MKKKRLGAFLFGDGMQKIIRLMKLVSFFLLAGFFQVSANIFSQTANIKLSMQEVALSDVIKEIQKQTEFTFFYSPEDINGVVVEKVELEKASLEKVLDLCLKGTNLDYEIAYKAVILRKDKEKDLKKITPLVPPVEQQQPQKKQLKGKVTDSKGEPVPGTTVIVKGTTIGTISDSNGDFILDVPLDAKTLAFSFVGMKTQEIPIAGKTAFNILLEEETVGMEEVVVVGYGVQKKVSVTGSVASVSSEQLKESPSANFVGNLAGRLTGLTTIQSSGQPGNENFQIYLRGVSTTNGQNPLILIDGVPRDNITTIDPYEVESVSVLKDASATAVFGVRGANGVILITTKGGEIGTAKVTVNADFGLQDFTVRPRTVNSWEFAELRNQALANDGFAPEFSQESIDKYRSGENPFMYPNQDWYKILVKDYSPLSRINVNVSGGTDRVKYFMNAAYTHQGGLFNTLPESELGYDPQFKMDKYNFRTNLDININSWIKSSVKLAGYIRKVNTSQRGDGNPLYVMVGIYQLSPTQPGPLTIDGYGVPAGQMIHNTTANNPYGTLNFGGFHNNEDANLNSSAGFDFDLKGITKGLKASVTASFDSKSNSDLTAAKSYTTWVYQISQLPDSHGVVGDSLIFTPSSESNVYPLSLSRSSGFSYKINVQAAINYDRTFGKHQVTGMFLAQRDNNEIASGSSDELLPYNVLGVAGRTTYYYDSRYLIEFNAGYNGSEQFTKERRFGFFPAVSAGWVVSNEQFMKSIKGITNLKLRASYGKVGNDKFGGNRFLYLDNISVDNGGSGSLGNGKIVNENLLGNPLISWETATKSNLGIDLILFKNLNFTGEVFHEDRDNILINSGTIPSLQGIPLSTFPKINAGRVINKGFELELGYNRKVSKDLAFTLHGTYSFNENTVKNMDEAPYDDSYAFPYRSTGYSLGQNFGYYIDWNSPGKGYYSSQEEIDNSGLTFAGVAPQSGDFVYKDVNGDQTIDDRDIGPIEYARIPRITYSGDISITYRNFTFSALFQATGQASRNYGAWGVNETNAGGYYSKYQLTAWTPERAAAGEKITYPRLTTIGKGRNAVDNDFFIMNSSYIRLKNAELAYNLPKEIAKRIGSEKIRLYVNGQNLFVWDKLLSKNWDPEVGGPTAIPIVRSMNAGLNITF